jgi:hypothetical protein
MSRRFLLLAAALSPATAFAQGVPQSEWPASVRAEVQDQTSLCRESGFVGRPGPDLVWRADFNHDGRPDYVVTAIDCPGGESMYGYNAGTPVSIHLSGPGGHRKAWSGMAVEGAELIFGPPDVLELTSRCESSGMRPDSFCATQVVYANGRIVERSAGSPAVGWTRDPASGRATVALRYRSSAVDQVWVGCASGQPTLSFRYRAGREPSGQQVRAGLLSEGVDHRFQLLREGTTATWSARPARPETIAILTGRLGEVSMVDRTDADGNQLGFRLPLNGSTAAIRAALQGCGDGSGPGAVPTSAGPVQQGPPAQASDDAQIRALVASIYDSYARGPGEGESAPDVYSPALAALVTRASDPEEGLGADPFCECQDYDQVRYAIRSVNVRDAAAEARVEFSNFGQPHLFTLRLVKTPSGWRVDDILSAHGSFRASLRPSPRRRR